MGTKRVRLTRARKAVGYTQEQLAEVLHVDPSTIKRWENAGSNPQPYQQPRLARLLKISTDKLQELLAEGQPPAGEDITAPQPAKSDQLAPQPNTVAEQARHSQREWLRVRQAPGARGRELNELAAWLYPREQHAPGGHILTGPGWLLDEPVELNAVRLRWSDTQYPVPPLSPVDHVLPLTNRGERYADYSRAVRDLVRPRLLENRLSYRLLDVSAADGLTLTCGTTTFFEAFDVEQSLAHEFKAAWLAADGSMPNWKALPLRAAVGDPFDPKRLLTSPGISTLTIRRDRRGEHRFVLHERDGAAVADGGGLCSVMPAGEFQPSSVDPADLRNDFSLSH
jgi:transcriptional regulator with XRE-family HTH domain